MKSTLAVLQAAILAILILPNTARAWICTGGDISGPFDFCSDGFLPILMLELFLIGLAAILFLIIIFKILWNLKERPKPTDNISRLVIAFLVVVVLIFLIWLLITLNN